MIRVFSIRQSMVGLRLLLVLLALMTTVSARAEQDPTTGEVELHASKSLGPDMEFVLWRPPGHDFKLVLPVRPGETPYQAKVRYLVNAESLEKTHTLKSGGEGTFFSFPHRSDKVIAVTLTSIGGPDPLVAKPTGIHRVLDPFVYKGAKGYILPMGVTFGMDDSEVQAVTRKVNDVVDILIAPGGADISPRLYKMANTFSKVASEPLDWEHYWIVKSFIENGRGFFFGICRGFQMGAVAMGCKLIQDIRKLVKNAVTHGTGVDGSSATHQVKTTSAATKDGFTAEAFQGAEEWTTRESRHHQALDDEGNPRVRVTAESPGDHVPEVVEYYDHGKLRGVGVADHPERKAADENNSLFQAVYEKGEKARNLRLERFLVSVPECEGSWASVHALPH